MTVTIKLPMHLGKAGAQYAIGTTIPRMLSLPMGTSNPWSQEGSNGTKTFIFLRSTRKAEIRSTIGLLETLSEMLSYPCRNQGWGSFQSGRQKYALVRKVHNSEITNVEGFHSARSHVLFRLREQRKLPPCRYRNTIYRWCGRASAAGKGSGGGTAENRCRRTCGTSATLS